MSAVAHGLALMSQPGRSHSCQVPNALLNPNPNFTCCVQRAAAVAGVAYQDRISHLCLHPKYGAWFSLRCLLVFDGIPYTGEALTPSVRTRGARTGVMFFRPRGQKKSTNDTLSLGIRNTVVVSSQVASAFSTPGTITGSWSAQGSVRCHRGIRTR